MSDIFSYLRVYGNAPFTKSGFNKIDALILSKLSYLDLNNIVPEFFDRGITLARAFELYRRTRNQRTVIWKNDPELFKALSYSRRFGGLKLSGFVSELARDEAKQFCALTIAIDAKLKFISYRGTDHSVTGWKEDFSFYNKGALPSQLTAVKYFSESAEAETKYILGGHSKGGNLALYTAQYCRADLKERIISVYNFDGPSLNRPLKSDKYHVFIPPSSVFGVMLNKSGDFSVIKSRAKSLFQHDVSTWEISGKDFLYENRRTFSGKYIERALDNFVSSLSEIEKTEFIRALFKIFYETGMDNFDDIIRNPLSVITSFKNLHKSERAVVLGTFRKAFKSIGNAAIIKAVG